MPSQTNFKRDFCKLSDCRNTLKNHKFDIQKMWSQEPPKSLSVIEQQGKLIKIIR